MRRFAEIKDEIIARDGIEAPYPKRADYFSYFLYHKGEVLGKASSRDGLPKLDGVIEKAFDQKAYDAAMAPYVAQGQAVMGQWEVELRAEHSALNDATYGHVYSMAYENGHSAGYDEVALYMDRYADFADNIIRANKPETV